MLKVFKGYRQLASIGRFTNDILSPYFGKYYVDYTSGGVNANHLVPGFFETLDEAVVWCESKGMKEQNY